MRTLSTLLLLLAFSAFLSGCADATPTMSGNDQGNMQGMDHNNMQMDASKPFDAQFIDSMTEHHQGALAMAQEALQQAEREEIKTMAAAVVAAQTAEIEQMQGWRTTWYPDLPATGGMNMEMGEMGLGNDDNLSFDQRFLAAMISHHQGAIEMAKAAQQNAEHQEIKDLADAIIAAQQGEIEQMQGWLQAESAASGETAGAGLPRNADGYVDISVPQLIDMLGKQDLTLVNVHIPFEGNLPGTNLSIPFDEIANRTDELPAKDETIVLYCRSGNMSTQAAKTLVQLGYTNIYELDGGFNAWVAAGNALEMTQ